MEIEQYQYGHWDGGSIHSLGSSSSACDGACSFFGEERRVIEQGCSQSEEAIKRKLIEVYSVRFCDKLFYSVKNLIFGFALLKPSGSPPNCHAVIFKRRSETHSIVDKQGRVTLNGPTSGIEVKDEVAIHLCLWALRRPRFNAGHADTLWRAGVEETDQVIYKKVNSEFGPLEVAFAVYNDGVEARLDVSLANWNALEGVEAFGDVEAGNSNFPRLEARSCLFHKSYEEAIQVMPGSDLTNLPLSRSVTVVPRGSALLVNVTIWRVDNSCRSQIPMFAKLSFDTMSAGTETEVIYGNPGNVVVRVTWSG